MYLKIIIVAFVVLLLGALVGFLAFPFALETIWQRKCNLKRGSELRYNWLNIPLSWDFKIYVFNVTNPEEIQNGGRPKLQEVGPFLYFENRQMSIVEENEQEDSLSYHTYRSYLHQRGLGIDPALRITMPHPLLQFTAISRLYNNSDNSIYEGLNIIFQPKSAFITETFDKLFFEGIKYNCAQEHAAAQAICESFMNGDIPAVQAVNDKQFKFVFFGDQTTSHKYKISRGIAKSETLGKILEFDDKKRLSFWPEADKDTCNKLRGTEGSLFSHFKREKKHLWFYSAQLCRSISTKLVGSASYKKLPALRYEIEFGNVSSVAELKCFCDSACPAAGTLDLKRCTKTPLIASLPHFYKADAQLLQDVEGLNPIHENHSSCMLFEKVSATILLAANRLQYSLAVEPIPALEVMAKLRPLTMPMFWVEQITDLDGSFTAAIHKRIFVPILWNNIVRWLAIALGGLGCLVGAAMLYIRSEKTKRVALVTPTEEIVN